MRPPCISKLGQMHCAWHLNVLHRHSCAACGVPSSQDVHRPIAAGTCPTTPPAGWPGTPQHATHKSCSNDTMQVMQEQQRRNSLLPAISSSQLQALRSTLPWRWRRVRPPSAPAQWQLHRTGCRRNTCGSSPWKRCLQEAHRGAHGQHTTDGTQTSSSGGSLPAGAATSGREQDAVCACAGVAVEGEGCVWRSYEGRAGLFTACAVANRQQGQGLTVVVCCQQVGDPPLQALSNPAHTCRHTRF